MINTFSFNALKDTPTKEFINFLKLPSQFIQTHQLPEVINLPMPVQVEVNDFGSTIKAGVNSQQSIKISINVNQNYKKKFQELNLITNKKYPLYRALKKFNISQQPSISKIIDCTAGFLGDSLWLLLFSQESLPIEAYESNPFLFILNSHSLSLGTYQNLNRLKLKFGNSLKQFQSLENHSEYLYFCDPMFQCKNKKSKNKKEIQFLEKLGGENNQTKFLQFAGQNNAIFKSSAKFSFDQQEIKPQFVESGKNVNYYIFIAN